MIATKTIAHAVSRAAIPWPQPLEIPFSPNGSLPEFGHPKRTLALAAMCDGSVRTFDKKMNPATMRALVTAAGGEAIPFEW